VLSLLPHLDILTEDQMEKIMEPQSSVKEADAILFLFDRLPSNQDDVQINDLKKIGSVLPEVKTWLVDCSNLKDYCSNFHVEKLPKAIFMRRTGGYDINYGLSGIISVL
jgi:hypothetical protein